MNYLETVGKNAKKAFEDLKNVKHKTLDCIGKKGEDPGYGWTDDASAEGDPGHPTVSFFHGGFHRL